MKKFFTLLALAVAFCWTSAPTLCVKRPPPGQKKRYVEGHYMFADGFYALFATGWQDNILNFPEDELCFERGICISKILNAIQHFMLGAPKQYVMNGLWKHDKRMAIAMHLILQNSQLLKAYFYDKTLKKNLIPHMLIKTCLPLLFMTIKKARKNKNIQWV